MNRRNAINNIMILSIGAVVLPSCGEKKAALVKFKNFSVTETEEETLNQLADTIIPKTNFIGAAAIQAHLFILKMVDDCYEPEQQKKFIAGFKEFNQLVKIKHGSAFTGIDSVNKIKWLTTIEQKKEIPEAVLFFYETSKRHTIQAFTSSKEYLTDVIKYKLVPGSNFKGCVPVKEA